MNVNRRGFLKVAAAAGAALTGGACGPSPDPTGSSPGEVPAGIPNGDYFKQVGADLSAASYGTPQLFIDLDRLDANCDSIVSKVGRDRFRIVEKSLPSLDLLSYIQKRANVDRFLVLHLPFLSNLLTAFPTADFLVGKLQPTAAVNQFFQSIAMADRPAAAGRVRFLVESRTRLEELVALAKALSLTLQVGVEVDGGLHRGGVRRVSDLPEVLKTFVENPGPVRFCGMLGYDGHVTAAPGAPGLEEYAARKTFGAFETTFASFIAKLKSDFPSLWRDDLVFNSGGTETYALHNDGPANDIAAGGGMLRPASYGNLFIKALQPALFVAAPVIQHMDTFELPFGPAQSTQAWDGQQSFTMYGGGWPMQFVWPPNVQPAPVESDSEGANIVCNQSLMIGPASPAIGPGDWVFAYARKSDLIFVFENILLVRSGRLVTERWRGFPRRY